MEEKEKLLDELFVSEDEIANQPKRVEEPVFTASKDNDSRSVNNAVNELSKEFDKKNKEELNKRKKDETLKNDVENEITASEVRKPRKSKVSFLLSLLSFPFVLLGGVLVWNYFIAEESIHPLSILTVLMCVSGFAVGVKSFIVGITKKGSFKLKIKPLAIGLLAVALAVVIVIFRQNIEKYAFLVAGCLASIVSFIALLSSALKTAKAKTNIVKIILSSLAFVGGVLLILAGTVLVDVVLYLQITGIYLVVVGCSLFVY